MILHFKEYDANRLKILLDDEVSQIIYAYDPQSFTILNKISFGTSALVYNVCWKIISKFVIKKFVGNSNEKAIINEIHLTGMANLYPNIIQFYEVTKLKGEMNYSLVLEYAEEISSAMSWLHVDKRIILGDLHPNNILIQKDTIKLADFGRSCLKGSVSKKSDIYSLGAIFWELTSCRSPFDFETKNNDPFEIFKIKPDILSGKREKPISGTDHKFITLYKKCWQYEPDERPDIHQVISEIINIEPINGQNFEEEIESEGKLDEYNNMPSCDDYDINSDKYKF
ncbi:kinase-like domain-containing protein [Rhizophagus clarus]|uniref:Kinase-like domain-containing protein n=1 Tax=Rhizophagus clarus TaxID=94130 RepID=A0A8H3LDH1_9GLOM|nr:kinase-like domain-containing protein [Rhizophagus clarus]